MFDCSNREVAKAVRYFVAVMRKVMYSAWKAMIKGRCQCLVQLGVVVTLPVYQIGIIKEPVSANLWGLPPDGANYS